MEEVMQYHAKSLQFESALTVSKKHKIGDIAQIAQIAIRVYKRVSTHVYPHFTIFYYFYTFIYHQRKICNLCNLAVYDIVEAVFPALRFAQIALYTFPPNTLN